MHYTFDFMSVFVNWPRLLEGAWLTIQLSALSIVLGFVVGTLCAIAFKSKIWLLQAVVKIYVEIIRNTPLLVQVFLVYFGLASIGLRLTAETAAVIALTVNVGAYTSEIMRAGINSIHPGQIEAAECLGMSKFHVYWHVVLLPAVERVYPSLTSQFILLMLNSSVCSAIAARPRMSCRSCSSASGRAPAPGVRVRPGSTPGCIGSRTTSAPIACASGARSPCRRTGMRPIPRPMPTPRWKPRRRARR